MKRLLPLMLGFVVLLASCVKKKETPAGDAHVRFVNAVNGSYNQDVYIDKVLASTSVGFGNQTPYITYAAGINLISYTNTSASDINLSYTYGSEVGDYATIYLFRDFSGNLVSGGIKDDMTAPAAGKARVRFVNLHNSLSNALLMSVTGGANLFTYLVFGTASPYYDVAPGTTFTPQAVGVTTAPVIDLNLRAGKIYTVWLTGTAATEIYAHAFLQNY